tara:strand:- start:61990 stop:62229 length:240 start_codon:yes stop_codon:yes gene_type:complete
MVQKLLKDFKEGTKIFGEDIASIVNFILLTFVYFLGVGLTSVIAKIFGKRFLEFKKEKKSHWSDLNLDKKKKEGYYRQF